MKPVRKPLPVDPSIDVQRKLVLEPESNPTGHVPLEQAHEFRFDPDATAPSRVNAWWMAEASWLAYWHDAAAITKVYRERAGLQCELIEVKGAECTVAFGDRFAIVAFRGTQPGDWSDLLDDACFTPVAWDTGHVHQGFARRLTNISDELAARACTPAGIVPPVVHRAQPRGRGGDPCGVPPSGTRRMACAPSDRRSSATASSPACSAERWGPAARATSTITTWCTRVPPEPFALPHGLYTHVDHGRWINQDGQIGATRPAFRSSCGMCSAGRTSRWI